MLLDPRDPLVEEINPTIPYSDRIFTSKLGDELLDNWEKYNSFYIKSWDLAHSKNTGSVIRFENTRSRSEFTEFKLRIEPTNSVNFFPNMKIINEEVHANLSSLNPNRVGGIQKFGSTTTHGEIQLLIVRIGRMLDHGWLAVADQIFIPLNNVWTEQIVNEPSLNFKKSTAQVYDVRSARSAVIDSETMLIDKWRMLQQ